jgi:dihydrofolate reductase
MRKLIVAAFVSLDGVMQAPGGPEEDLAGDFEFGGWTVPYSDETIDEAIGASMAKPFELLLGRKTWEISSPAIGRMFRPSRRALATASATRRSPACSTRSPSMSRRTHRAENSTGKTAARWAATFPPPCAS